MAKRLPKTVHLVTKERLIEMLRDPNPRYVHAVVGRALIAIFNRQTESEKCANATTVHNGIGFTGADAVSGCIGAKTFIKHGRFPQPWQFERWLKPNKNGEPRLCKYWKQLDEIARAKQLPSVDAR